MTKAYEAQREAVKAEQSGKSYDDIREQMEKVSEFMLELDNLKPQEHNWVDRGEVLSCEGANHPYHRVFKRR